MLQKSGKKTTWDVQHLVNNGINYTKLNCIFLVGINSTHCQTNSPFSFVKITHTKRADLASSCKLKPPSPPTSLLKCRENLHGFMSITEKDVDIFVFKKKHRAGKSSKMTPIHPSVFFLPKEQQYPCHPSKSMVYIYSYLHLLDIFMVFM